MSVDGKVADEPVPKEKESAEKAKRCKSRETVTAPIPQNEKPRCELCGAIKRGEKFSIIEDPAFKAVKPASASAHIPKYVQQFYLQHLSGELADKKKFDRFTRSDARIRLRQFGLIPRPSNLKKPTVTAKAEYNRRSNQKEREKKLASTQPDAKDETESSSNKTERKSQKHKVKQKKKEDENEDDASGDESQRSGDEARHKPKRRKTSKSRRSPSSSRSPSPSKDKSKKKKRKPRKSSNSDSD